MAKKYSEAEIEAAITAFTRTPAFRRAEKDLDYVAVCLLGHREPIPVRVGSNATRSPVYIRASRSPLEAAKEFDRAHAIHPVVVLEYVWTRSTADATRLKAALDRQILGTDPDMIALRGSWRDMPEWGVAWPIVLMAAIRDLQAGGETIEYFSERMRIQRIRQHSQSSRRG